MRKIVLGSLLSLAMLASPALAAKCGNTGAGFESWKKSFAAEAKENGVNAKAISALMGTKYATATIKADRNQHSFKLSLKQFMAKRGAPAIVSQGRRLKQANAALFASIEKKYGVPAGPLIAIWGMETAFGHFTGSQNVLSATATLAYDCRRTEFFQDQLYAMLKLVGSGRISASAKGAMHGELGQTQFMPKNVLLYGAGNLNSKEGALASTARFLVGHGWQRGEGYQRGQANFGAIQGWNAASVYQQAIAIMGKQIDGN
ncbi:MAG: murein transglycosylase [Phyllobacteriaceae bacterium]|jgi:membrane-bound lytic murein transglycosylase B|nr:murein transglycosylase [Phyllobacteriaceae bacterium]